MQLLQTTTPTLDIAYRAHGDASHPPVVLAHGYPDDASAWDPVAGALAERGYYCVAPYLRGYGGTRLRQPGAFRSAEQAALGRDMLEFCDALALARPLLVGHDWGSRAAAAAAALSPERARGLVVIGGYLLYDPAKIETTSPMRQMHAYWYQWLYQTEMGRRVVQERADELGRYLWQTWSPNWRFTDAEFEAVAASWHSDAFADMVIHSYRHRRGNAPGDPAYAADARRLAAMPTIALPTRVIQGEGDTVQLPASSEDYKEHFTGDATRTLVPVAGHFVHRERPDVFVDAVLSLADAR